MDVHRPGLIVPEGSNESEWDTISRCHAEFWRMESVTWHTLKIFHKCDSWLPVCELLIHNGLFRLMIDQSKIRGKWLENIKPRSIIAVGNHYDWQYFVCECLSIRPATVSPVYDFILYLKHLRTVIVC